jgi:NAD(P)-dependent dehydrogenase (short-subunit alcohol dehydrogenase family)
MKPKKDTDLNLDISNTDLSPETVDASLSPEAVDACIAVLTRLGENGADFAALPKDTQITLMKAAGQIARPDYYQLRQRRKAVLREKKLETDKAEREARAATGIRRARTSAVFTAPGQLRLDSGQLLLDPGALQLDPDQQKPNDEGSLSGDSERVLLSPRNCYVCKAEFTRLHHFYDALCPACAELNYHKRFQQADLTGQVALITGSRLKIGYQAALMMLRSGAAVIATTRFPVDSALRYAKEPDFAEWGDRLHIYGLDLRHTPSVELFCRYIEQNYDRLDILINNAAQTVRRPPAFYAHLMEWETAPVDEQPAVVRKLLRNHHQCLAILEAHDQLPAAATAGLAGTDGLAGTADAGSSRSPGIGLRESARLSQVPYVSDVSRASEAVFPAGKLDADLQQVDLRSMNSWRLKIGEIETAEMLEIQLINAIAPFVLCNKLIPLMKREITGQKHIVNVSAMEGKFLRFKKGERHPHTNMAKAALNMLTHTSASELAKHGIFMNAVDTGWVTDEDPARLAEYKEEVHDFQPPLDIVDGAARVCDPFFDGILTGRHWCGKFLKDYVPIDW